VRGLSPAADHPARMSRLLIDRNPARVGVHRRGAGDHLTSSINPAAPVPCVAKSAGEGDKTQQGDWSPRTLQRASLIRELEPDAWEESSLVAKQ